MRIVNNKQKKPWTFLEFWRESMRFQCLFKLKVFNLIRAISAYIKYRKAVKKDGN